MLTIEDFERDNKENKLRSLFTLLDSDQNGLVGIDELESGFRMIELSSMKSGDVREIAQQTLLYADHDQDGFLNFQEFQDFYFAVVLFTLLGSSS